MVVPVIMSDPSAHRHRLPGDQLSAVGLGNRDLGDEADSTTSSWHIGELARAAGVSTRTLRHYQHLGLLLPSHTSASGVRHYNQSGLIRLQHILLMRDLGLSLATIKSVVDQELDQVEALEHLIAELHNERGRLDRRIRAASLTLAHLMQGKEISMDTALDGFNDQYAHEVTERWGAESQQASAHWWRAKSAGEKLAWKDASDSLIAGWKQAQASGEDPRSAIGQQLAADHITWLSQVPGTPTHRGDHAEAEAMVRGLGEMYVSDPRFAATYGGLNGARFVRDTLHHFLDNDGLHAGTPVHSDNNHG